MITKKTSVIKYHYLTTIFLFSFTKYGKPRLGTSKHFLQQKEEHLITYKSGGNSPETDFIMTRRADLKEMQGNTQRDRGCISASAAMCSHKDTRRKMYKDQRKRIKIWTLKGEKVN